VPSLLTVVIVLLVLTALVVVFLNSRDRGP
jgi:Tfp pilus assembly protein PilW